RSPGSGFRRTTDGRLRLAMAEPAGADPAVSFEVQAAAFDEAIQAFEACDPPDDRALAAFIERHAVRLTPLQRQAVLRLVTWPVRGPGQSGADLGMAALTHF